MVYQRLWFVCCDSGVNDWYIKDCCLSVVTVESMSGISKTVVCRL